MIDTTQRKPFCLLALVVFLIKAYLHFLTFVAAVSPLRRSVEAEDPGTGVVLMKLQGWWTFINNNMEMSISQCGHNRKLCFCLSLSPGVLWSELMEVTPDAPVKSEEPQAPVEEENQNPWVTHTSILLKNITATAPLSSDRSVWPTKMVKYYYNIYVYYWGH